MESNDELDRMIDSALAGYSSAQPLAGLEERVLNRVRLTDSARRRVLGWTVAIVAVTFVLLIAILVRMPYAPVSHGIARVQTPAPARPVPEVEQVRVAPKHRRGRVATRRAGSPRPLPKLEQFPAPAPLTAEERALLAFVEHYPDEAKQLVTEQQKSGEPIEIQLIRIPPLQSNGAQ